MEQENRCRQEKEVTEWIEEAISGATEEFGHVSDADTSYNAEWNAG